TGFEPVTPCVSCRYSKPPELTAHLRVYYKATRKFLQGSLKKSLFISIVVISNIDKKGISS
ncbi:MAG: hypothetical protein ACK4TN_03300, partial [Brevinematales bacterium]